MNMNLENKVAIVTGGAQGIGRAISLRLAKAGATIVVNYNKSADKAKSLVDEIEAMGGKALSVQADVSKFDEAKKLVDKAVEAYGTVHILVNNAGITKDGLILRMTEEQFDQVIDVNLKGAWHMIKHLSKILLKENGSKIINIASVSGILGNAGQSNYSASKAGVIGLTKAVAREFASRNVNCNCVAPGFISSDMTDELNEAQKANWQSQIPLGRFGKKEEVAELVLFLASQQSNYITGQTISIDGGLVM